MEGQDRAITRQYAHFSAARRLADGLKRHPEAHDGLGRAMRFHTQRVAALADELGGRRGGNLAGAPR
jgi:hypothetical protein